MAYRTLFVLTLALLSHSLAAPAAHLSFKLSQTASRIPTFPPTSTTQDAETTFCRQVHLPPSKCVDPPAFTYHQVEFCPYRLCAPKYIEAELCPANHHFAAKAKCVEEEITRDVYKCDHIYEKTKTVPSGCTVGEGDCKEVRYCSCMKIPDVTTKQLKFLAIFEPYCGPLH